MIFDLQHKISRIQSNSLVAMGEALTQYSHENSMIARNTCFLQESQQLEQFNVHQQQQDCIQAILDGNVLVVLPMGKNKLIFQAPAVTRFTHSIPNIAFTIVLFTYTALGKILNFIADSSTNMPTKSNNSAHEIEEIIKSTMAKEKDGISLSNYHELKNWFIDLGLSKQAVHAAVQFISSPDIGVRSIRDLLYLDDDDITELTGTIIKSKVGVGKFKAALSALRNHTLQTTLASGDQDQS